MAQGLLVLEGARLARERDGDGRGSWKGCGPSRGTFHCCSPSTPWSTPSRSRASRVPATLFVQALQIKPVVLFEHGKVKTIKRARTRRKAVKRLLALMEDNIGGGLPLHVCVQHAGVPEEAEKLRDEVAGRFEPYYLSVSEFSLVMSSQTGPGLLGLAFYEDPGLTASKERLG